MIAYPDTGLRHLRFVYHSILTLNKILHYIIESRNFLEAIEVFSFINKSFNVNSILNIERVAQNSHGIEIRKYNNYVNLIKYTGINFKEMES